VIGDEPSKFAEKLGQTLDSHGWRILSAQPVIPGTRKIGILITGYADSTATFIGRDWSGVPEPAKTLHRLLVEAVVGNVGHTLSLFLKISTRDFFFGHTGSTPEALLALKTRDGSHQTQDFEIDGRKYQLELRHSDKLGKLNENELVIWQVKAPS
jgi:hypothetical protein